MSARTGRSIAAIAVATALLAACGGTGDDDGRRLGRPGHPHVVAQRHRRALEGLFARVALGFEADHPNVTIENIPIQNEELKAKLADALDDGGVPGRLPAVGWRADG